MICGTYPALFICRLRRRTVRIVVELSSKLENIENPTQFLQKGWILVYPLNFWILPKAAACTSEASSVEQISGICFTGGKGYSRSESCKLATLLNVA